MSVDSKTMVTVCCITFNQRNYLRQCLESLVNQVVDFKYEIIVHDDVSTDGTRDIVREFAEKYPDLVVPILEEENQYSKGGGALLDAIIAPATGKYLVWCEGDDYWCDPHKLQLQVEALEAHPECALCVHATDTVDREGNPLPTHFPEVAIDHSLITTEEYMRLVLGEGNWLFHFNCFMVAADLYREYMGFMKEGFPSRFKVGDLPAYLYFALQGDLYFIDRTMSIYRMESGGFMSQLKEDPEFALKVHQSYIDGLTDFDAYSDYRYHDYVTQAVTVRRFEIDRLNRRFDRIVQTPEYRPLIRKRGLLKAIAFYVLGFGMALFGRKDKEGRG